MAEWTTLPASVQYNPAEAGSVEGHSWTVYESVDSEAGSDPGVLLIFPDHNVAVWNDRLLILTPDGNEPPTRTPVPVTSSWNDRILVNFYPPAIKRDTNTPTEAMYVKLALGALLYTSVAWTGSGMIVKPERLLNNHSLAHMNAVLLSDSLTPAQQWLAFCAATRQPGMSPELIATLVSVRYETLLAEVLCHRKTSDPVTLILFPFLYRRNGGSVEPLLVSDQSDQTWWYVSRLATSLLNSSTAGEGKAIRGNVDDGAYIPLDQDRFTGHCQDCPRSSRATGVEVATGDTFSWDDFEFFTGDARIAGAIMDVRELDRAENPALRKLINRFIAHRLCTSEHRRPAERTRGFLPDDPHPPIIESDSGAAYLPVPKGFFAAVSASARTVGLSCALNPLMVAGFDPGVSLTGEHVVTGAKLPGRVAHASITHLFEFIDTFKIDPLINTAAELAGPGQEEGWAQAQWDEIAGVHLTYRLFGADGHRAYIEPGNSSSIRSALFFSNFCQQVFTAVKDYYESYDESTSLPLSWHLRLVGFEVTIQG